MLGGCFLGVLALPRRPRPASSSWWATWGSTYSENLWYFSSSNAAFAQPPTKAKTARMQIGTSSSFGDSCGPGWASEHVGVGVLEVLQLRLLVDVVGGDRDASTTVCTSWCTPAAAPRGSPKNVRYVARTV